MVPRHVTTGRTEPCNTLRLPSQGLLEEAGEMHPNNLTSVHYTKRMPKWQQTNKNDADQALVWWRCERAGVASSARQGVWLESSNRNSPDTLLGPPPSQWVPSLLGGSLPYSTGDNALWLCVQASSPMRPWAKTRAVIFLSLCLDHSTHVELKQTGWVHRVISS